MPKDETLSHSQVTVLKSLLARGTPGEWKADIRLGIAAVYTGETRHCLAGIDKDPGAVLAVSGTGEKNPYGTFLMVSRQQEANMALIAALHNAAPALLQMAEENARLRAALAKADNDLNDACDIIYDTREALKAARGP
jgi:hypothetical protein